MCLCVLINLTSPSVKILLLPCDIYNNSLPGTLFQTPSFKLPPPSSPFLFIIQSQSNKHSSPEHHTPLHTPPWPTWSTPASFPRAKLLGCENPHILLLHSSTIKKNISKQIILLHSIVWVSKKCVPNSDNSQQDYYKPPHPNDHPVEEPNPKKDR